MASVVFTPNGAVFESSYMNSNTRSYSGADKSSLSSARPVTIRKNRLHILVRTSLAISGLKLRIEAYVARLAQGGEGAVKRAGDAANLVVGGGVRAVQADGHAGHAGVLEALYGFGRQQRGGAGRHVGAQSQAHAVADQIVEIRPLQRVAAGEDHQRLAERTDLIQQAETLCGCQLVRVAFGLGGGAAVDAGQVARLRNFPDHQHRALVEVHRCSRIGGALQ
jgi:hypothetical protein